VAVVAGEQVQTCRGKMTLLSQTTRNQNLCFQSAEVLSISQGLHLIYRQELNPPLSTPKPLCDDETERVNDYLTFREAIRNGPLYAILEKNSFTDDKGRLNKRTGFDPFTGMEKYSARFDKPTRTVPDLSQRTYRT